VVPTSEATVAIETFMAEESSAIRNWAEARVARMIFPDPARGGETTVSALMPCP